MERNFVATGPDNGADDVVATEMRITSARFMNVISANVFIQKCTRYGCAVDENIIFRSFLAGYRSVMLIPN